MIFFGPVVPGLLLVVVMVVVVVVGCTLNMRYLAEIVIGLSTYRSWAAQILVVLSSASSSNVINLRFKCVTGKLEYQAQSPDEAALVSAARNFGFVFKVNIWSCEIFIWRQIKWKMKLLVRERSALATLIFTLRVCLSVILSFCLSVRNFGAKYLGNEAR